MEAHLVGFAAAVCAWAAPGDATPIESVVRAATVPRQADCAAQMRYASLRGAALKRCDPKLLTSARRSVAECWIAVRVYFPAERARIAEASFRAAELLRWIGDIDAAAGELELVRGLRVESSYLTRATLELGHIERRRRRFERAIDLYTSVASDRDASARHRDDAGLWIGKTHGQLGRLEEARRWLRRIAESSIDDHVRVRAYDEWALTYLVDDDLEAATGVLALARNALAPSAARLTRSGELVRVALMRMRCIVLLERAVAQRRSDANRRDAEIEDE